MRGCEVAATYITRVCTCTSWSSTSCGGISSTNSRRRSRKKKKTKKKEKGPAKRAQQPAGTTAAPGDFTIDFISSSFLPHCWHRTSHGSKKQKGTCLLGKECFAAQYCRRTQGQRHSFTPSSLPPSLTHSTSNDASPVSVAFC